MRDKKTSDTDAGKRQKIQNDRKANRLIKEIHELKKMKKRDIALFVLQNTDYWLPELPRNLVMDNIQNELQDAEQKDKELLDSLSKRALIRMSNHGDIKKIVGQFRQDYPSWNEKLPGLIAVLGKKQRDKDELSKTKRRQEERKRRKEKNKEKLKNGNAADEKLSIDNDNQNVIQESSLNSDGEESLTQDSEIDEEMESEVEERESNDEMDSDNEESDESAKNSSHSIDSDVSSKMNTPHNIGKDKADTFVSRQARSAKNVDKQEGDIVIKRLNVNQQNEELFPVQDVIPDLKQEIKNQNKCVKDSFFLGGVSESESENDENSEVQENKPSFENKVRINSFENKKRERDSFNGYNNKGSERQRKSMNKHHMNNDRKNSNYSRGNSKFERYNKYDRKQHDNNFTRSNPPKNMFFSERNIKQNNEGIHPSWAAKKKMADSAHINIQMKGNIITFDENGRESTRNFTKKPVKQNTLSNEVRKSDNLHPSWAAKKEQKGIQQFSGKKTVFGDDD